MLDKSFGLLFYLKKPKNYTTGPVPVYLRITVDGIPKELSTKRYCDPSRWSSPAGRASGTKEEVRALNAYLDTLQAKAYEAKRGLIETGQVVTATAIKDHLLGTDQRNKMLIQIFERYNDRVKKLIGIEYSKATWIKYDRTKRFTQLFIQWKYRMPDVPLQSLNLEFINCIYPLKTGQIFQNSWAVFGFLEAWEQRRIWRGRSSFRCFFPFFSVHQVIPGGLLPSIAHVRFT